MMRNVILLFSFLLIFCSSQVLAQEEELDVFLKGRQQEGKKFEKKRTVNIYRVLFASGKASLTEKDREYLQNKVIPYILRFPPYALITVEGHTDNTGDTQLNLALSKARADSVRAFLIYQGIDPMRLAAEGYGKSFPIATNKTDAGRTQNRRVTMKLEDTGSGADIHTADGQTVSAKYIQYEGDGTISYSKSDSDPITKMQQSKVKYVKYKDGTTYDPNNQITGTVRLKNGQEVRARVISREPGYISYKTSDTSPVVRLKASEVTSIRYADGTEIEVKDTMPIAQGKGFGAIAFVNGGEIPAYDLGKDDKNITYRAVEGGSVIKVKKAKVHYIKKSDGSIEYISAVTGVDNSFNIKWLNRLTKLTRLSVFADFGVIPLNVKKSAIDFTYVDESPSKDRMRTLIDLEKRFIAYGGQAGLEWETDHAITWRAYYQYAVNSEGSTKAFGFGLGKIIGKNRNTRIGADVQIGSASVKLGDLIQNDEWIQVNSARFFSHEVKMRYRNYFVAINPYVSFEKPLVKGLFLRLNIGASAGLHTKSNITFRGEGEDGKKLKAKEKTTVENVTFILDGERTTSAKLFSILGPQVKLGVYYSLFSRDK